MEKKRVITIGREFGSNGHEIGRQLAERLGISMYDKDLLTIAAQKSGMSIEMLAGADEKVTGRFLAPYAPFGVDVENMNDKLFQVQSSIIRDLAAKESCVIIGRLADYILRDEQDCMKVFIYAPFEERVRTIKEKHQISEDAARKLVKRMDAARRSYYSYYSNNKWSQKEGKDLLLNRQKFGIKGCVDILETMVRTTMA